MSAEEHEVIGDVCVRYLLRVYQLDRLAISVDFCNFHMGWQVHICKTL